MLITWKYYWLLGLNLDRNLGILDCVCKVPRNASDIALVYMLSSFDVRKSEMQLRRANHVILVSYSSTSHSMSTVCNDPHGLPLKLTMLCRIK